MIVNLQNLMPDGFGKYEQPTLLLTTLSDDPICYISNPLSFTAKFEYSDVSEINFSVADKNYVDGEWLEDSSYDELIGMRKIIMEPYGAFLVNNPTISEDDGHDGRHIKEVSCQSYEITLAHRMMPPLEGTFLFNDPTGQSKDTITAIILENAPGWTFAPIPSSISKKYRTFSTAAQSVYAFMSGEGATSYGCLFTYDTINKIIYTKDITDEVPVAPIHLDRFNLIKSQDIEQLSDEIVTCLSVYGADDVSIREVSPLASPKIYNLDYFIELGDIDEDTAKAWNTWKEKFNIYQKLFSDLYAQYYTNQLVANNEEAILVDLEGELSAMEAVLETYLTDTTGDHTEDRIELESNMSFKQAEIDVQQNKVDAANEKIESDLSMMADITKKCSFENNFTEEQLSVIQMYIKEDSLQESSFQVSTVADTPNSVQVISSNDRFSITIESGDLYRTDDYAEMTEDEWDKLDLSVSEKEELQNTIDALDNTYLGHQFFKINSGICNIFNESTTFELYGPLVDSTVSFSDTVNDDGSRDCIVTFGFNQPTWNGDEVSYSTALFVASGQLINFSYDADIDSDNTDTMNFELIGGIMTLTCDSSIDMRQHVLQDLYEFGVTALNELAYPAYEFAVSPANLFTASDFEWFRQNIKMGEKVYIGIGDDDYYLSPILTGVEVDFYDPTALELLFSNRFQHKSEAFSLADLIGKTAHTAASLDASKFNYNAFIESNVQNDVTNLIENALDLSVKSIINSVNQNIVINGQGIHLQKYDPATNTFDPGQLWLTNNQIVFTNDAWQTADLAIGRLETPDGASTMGIVGQSIIGEIFIGNKLLIEATNPDANFGGDNITHFRVDAGGVKLANGAIYIQGPAEEHNQIIIDPQYGIMAGNNTLFKMGDSDFELDILDENGDMIRDAELYDKFGLTIPPGAKFYFDVNTGNLAFRGDVYAENGYFNGDVVAQNLTISDTATVTGLVVGNNVTMGPNATISWDNVTGTGTVITQSDIKTISISADQITTGTLDANTVVISGWIWDDVEGSAPQRILGVNINDNLQIGTVSNANYKDINIYAVENINLVPSGGDDKNDYILRASSSGVDVSGNLSVDGDLVATLNDLGDYISSGDDAYFTSLQVSSLADSTTTSSYRIMHTGSSGKVYASDITYSDLSSALSGSTRRIKHDIAPISDESLAPEKLYAIDVVQFKYNNDVIEEDDERYDILLPGFIAEDLYEIYPRAVHLDLDGKIKSWNPIFIIPPMLKLIQDQKKEINQLRADLDALLETRS